MLRKPQNNIRRHSLYWNPQGIRNIGRPKQNRRRTVEIEGKTVGWTWTKMEKTYKNGVRYRSVVAALCSTRSCEE
jgi:hypothetical protein